ncbi:hypothetical protein D3C86_1639090 [compost metagenome]
MPCRADITGRGRLASTVAACAFMATSNAALVMPKRSSIGSSSVKAGMARMPSVQSANATPPSIEARPLPSRATQRPTGPIARMAPPATASMANESMASDSPKRALMVGMWTPQVAKVAPLTKNSAMVPRVARETSVMPRPPGAAARAGAGRSRTPAARPRPAPP